MRKLIYTLSLVGGLLSASTLHAQGIFSTAELSRSSRSISMGGITSVSGPNAFSVYENASAVAFSDKKLEAGAMYIHLGPNSLLAICPGIICLSMPRPTIRWMKKINCCSVTVTLLPVETTGFRWTLPVIS